MTTTRKTTTPAMPPLSLDRGLQFEIGHDRLAIADTALAWLSTLLDEHVQRALSACQPPQRLAILLCALERVDPASSFAYYRAPLAACRQAQCVRPLLHAMESKKDPLVSLY
jgi:hypothetical protein